jgi:hypothetical protein
MERHQTQSPSQGSKRQSSQLDAPAEQENVKRKKPAAAYPDDGKALPPPIKTEMTTESPTNISGAERALNPEAGSSVSPDVKSEAKSSADVARRTRTENALKAAKARGLPTEYFRVTEDGSLDFGVSQEETTLWKDFINFRHSPEPWHAFWGGLRQWGRSVLKGRNMPTATATTEKVAKCYYDYLVRVFPVTVLKAILEEDGMIDDKMMAGRRKAGHLTKAEIRLSVRHVSLEDFDIDFVMASLKPKNISRSFLRDYLNTVEIPPPPAIVGWYLRTYDGRDKVNEALQKIKEKFGFYEEFVWDEFGLGIVIKES